MARFSMRGLPAPSSALSRVAVVTSAGAKASVGAKAAKGTFKVGKWGIKGFMWGMSVSQLLDLLGFVSPEKLQLLYDTAEKAGFNLHDLKDSVDETTSALIWGLAAQVGFTPEELESAGFHAEDIIKYAKVAVRYTMSQRDAHDDNQIDVAESEEGVENLQRKKSIAYACDRLMLTGPGRARQLYHLALVINSIKDEHVLDFEQHERTWGKVPSEGIIAL
jgi:hypothetical protein